MVRKLAAVTALTLMTSSPLVAQILVVEGLQSPAWVERGGAREPLASGMALHNRDKVYTGRGSRALLRMAEGSAVKLGENAVLTVDDLLEKKGVNARQLVTASLDVLRGAFRFTTGVFAKQSAERDVKIKIAAVTAGIRGTDVWGKSEAERDVVCLIEGKIAVQHGGQEFAMQEPLSFFIAPRKGKPAPVAPVSKQQMDEWSEETEIREGNGAIKRGGRYRVDVASTRDESAAQQSRNKLREAGFPAQIESVRDSYGNEEHQVRISNLPGVKDARALAEKLKALGFAEARAR